MKKFLKEHYLIIALILFFLVTRIIIMLRYYGLIFDGAVYIGNAKFLYSFGRSAYFESLRPLVLPLILGLGWLLGLDILAWGKMVELFFSAGTLVLVYVLASRLHSKTAGIVSAILLAFTPVYFLYSDKILTGIPSAFFALVSFYFFINKKYELSGLMAAVSFMTRFPQGILLIAYSATFLALKYQTKIRKIVNRSFARFIWPYLFIVLLFFIFNYYMYRGADTPIEAITWPFVHGTFTINTMALWMYAGTWSFYFVELFKQNWFFIFSLVFIGFYIYEKKYRQQWFNFLLFAPALLLVYFTYLDHKEVRFALIFIPYLSIMSSIALVKIYEFIQTRKKLLILFFAIFLILVYFLKVPKVSLTEYRSPRVHDICRIMQENNLSQEIILTTPYPLVCLDNKVDMNLFSMPLLLNMTAENPEKPLVYAPNTFPCASGDTECENQKTNALEKFQNQYNLLYYNNNTEYPIYVFTKP
jgi:hypothetical protein